MAEILDKTMCPSLNYLSRQKQLNDFNDCMLSLGTSHGLISTLSEQAGRQKGVDICTRSLSCPLGKEYSSHKCYPMCRHFVQDCRKVGGTRQRK